MIVKIKKIYGSCFFDQNTLYFIVKLQFKQEGKYMFILLAGGLLVIIVAVVVAVVSSVVSAVAAETDFTE